jgi:hypothetical protein
VRPVDCFADVEVDGKCSPVGRRGPARCSAVAVRAAATAETEPHSYRGARSRILHHCLPFDREPTNVSPPTSRELYCRPARRDRVNRGAVRALHGSTPMLRGASVATQSLRPTQCSTFAGFVARTSRVIHVISHGRVGLASRVVRPRTCSGRIRFSWSFQLGCEWKETS